MTTAFSSNTGLLTSSSGGAAMRDVLQAAGEEVMDAVRDSTKAGQLMDAVELAQNRQNHVNASGETVADVFRRLDKDGGGELDRRETRRALKELASLRQRQSRQLNAQRAAASASARAGGGLGRFARRRALHRPHVCTGLPRRASHRKRRAVGAPSRRAPRKRHQVAFYGFGLMGPDIVASVFSNDSIEATAWQQCVAIAFNIPAMLLSVYLLSSRVMGIKKLQIVGFVTMAASYGLFLLLRALGAGPWPQYAAYCLLNFTLSFGPNVTTFVLPSATRGPARRPFPGARRGKRHSSKAT